MEAVELVRYLTQQGSDLEVCDTDVIQATDLAVKTRQNNNERSERYETIHYRASVAIR